MTPDKPQPQPQRVEAPTLKSLVKNIDTISDDELDALISRIREGRRRLAIAPPRKRKQTDTQKSITRKKKRTKASMMTKEELDAELDKIKGLLG